MRTSAMRRFLQYRRHLRTPKLLVVPRIWLVLYLRNQKVKPDPNQWYSPSNFKAARAE
jgi:hypothetical protein